MTKEPDANPSIMEIPSIVGDGIHDDTDGVQAFIDGKPFTVDGGHVEINGRHLNGGVLVISKRLVAYHAEEFTLSPRWVVQRWPMFDWLYVEHTKATLGNFTIANWSECGNLYGHFKYGEPSTMHCHPFYDNGTWWFLGKKVKSPPPPGNSELSAKWMLENFLYFSGAISVA